MKYCERAPKYDLSQSKADIVNSEKKTALYQNTSVGTILDTQASTGLYKRTKETKL